MLHREFLHFSTVEGIKDFSSLVRMMNAKCYIQKGEYIVDAGSPLGILSLDLNGVVCFFTEADLPEIFYNKIEKYNIEKKVERK